MPKLAKMTATTSTYQECKQHKNGRHFTIYFTLFWIFLFKRSYFICYDCQAVLPQSNWRLL